MTTAVLKAAEQAHVLAGPGPADGVLRFAPVRSTTTMTFTAVDADGRALGQRAGIGLALPVTELAQAGSGGVQLSVSPDGAARFKAGERATFRAAIVASSDEVLLEDLELGGLREAPVLRVAVDGRRRVVVTRLGASAGPAEDVDSAVHALGRAVRRAGHAGPSAVERLYIDTSASMQGKRQVVQRLCDAVAALCGHDTLEVSALATPDARGDAPWIGSVGHLLREAAEASRDAHGGVPLLLITDLPPSTMPPEARAVVLADDDVLDMFRVDRTRAFGVSSDQQRLVLDAHDDDATSVFLHTLSRWLMDGQQPEEGRDIP